MLTVYYTNQFKTDLKKVKKDAKDAALIMQTIQLLANNEPLPASYRPHQLTGSYKNCMECHIKPDLLLIYQIDNDVLILKLLRLGSHSALFK